MRNLLIKSRELKLEILKMRRENNSIKSTFLSMI
jgi:hypothetical protein